MKIDMLFDNSSVGLLYQMFETGELHVSMDLFAEIRDSVNRIVFSINNWLETQPAESRELISEEVCDILRVMKRYAPHDLSLEIFELAVLDRKIGYTYMNSDGSFCLQALFAYRTYYLILKEIVKRNNIPIIDQKTKSYPDFDDWFIDGAHMDAVRAFNEYKSKFGTPNSNFPLTAEQTEKYTDTDCRDADEEIERFRVKVTSCCAVCKELYEASCE